MPGFWVDFGDKFGEVGWPERALVCCRRERWKVCNFWWISEKESSLTRSGSSGTRGPPFRDQSSTFSPLFSS